MIRLTSESIADGIVDRGFAVPSPTVGDDVAGVLWTPASPGPHPLALTGHGGSLHKRQPALEARARRLAAEHGFAVAAIDAPGHGERERSAADAEHVAAIGRARRVGEPMGAIIAELNQSIAERAVPEWRAVLNELLELPEIDPGAVGYTGMTLGSAIGFQLLAEEPRIDAAVLGGYLVWDELLAAARRITVPVTVVVAWDDPEIPREGGFALFEALGSSVKTLHANPGSHRRIPAAESEESAQFLGRHLGMAGYR